MNFGNVNDAPDLDLDSTTGGFDTTAVATVNGGPVKITSPNVSIGDIDSTEIHHASIWILNPQSGDQLGVDGLPNGFVATLQPDGTLDIRHPSGPRPFAEYEAAIEAVTFSATTGNVTTERTIAVQIADPAGGTTTCGSVVTVNPAPVDAVNDTLTAKTEDTPFTIAASALTGNDASAVTFVSVQDASGGIVSLSGGNITFTPTANYFGAASFTYTIRDSAGLTDTATASFNINNVNDGPVLDLDSTMPDRNSVTIATPGGSAVRVTSANVSIIDSDDANVQSASLSITNAQGGDTLGLAGSLPGGITATFDANGRGVTLNGLASRADYEAAIEAITFSTTNSSTTTRNIAVNLFDGAGAGGGSVAQITINSAPAITSVENGDVTEDSQLIYGPNVVFNPGFEQSANGWSSSPGTSSLVSSPHSGSTSLFFTSHTNAFASQTISTNAGQLYELGFWFKGFAQIDVLLNNIALAPTITNSGFADFTFQTVQFVGTGGSATLKLQMFSGGGYLDDVSVQSISPPQQQIDSGTIVYNDPNGGVPTASAVALGAGYVGTFSFGQIDGNSVDWNFVADNSALQFLGANQTVTQTYAVTLTDSYGATDTENVTVTLHGVNDAPVITSNGGDIQFLVVPENTTAVTTIAVSDVDVGDTRTWSLEASTLRSSISAAPASSPSRPRRISKTPRIPAATGPTT